MSGESKYEQGNILASALIVMLAMNMLAITLVQTSTRELKTADFKTIDSTIFYLAESCINDTVRWFSGFSQPPAAQLPYTITQSNISNMYSGTETTSQLNALAKYSYNCTTNSLTVKSVEASESGAGDNISLKDSYGISGDLRPKYYYTIESNGAGPSNNKKKLITIVSVRY